MRLRLHPAALVELSEAVDYFEEHRTGFGALLFDEVTLRVAQAARWPHSGTPVVGFAERYDVRQFLIKRFGFLLVTALVRDERIVVALAHTRREPQYWRDRLG